MYSDRHITVIVPAHNEAKSIAGVVRDLRSLCTSSERRPYLPDTRPKYLTMPLVDRIVVCDNGSTDATGEIAVQAGAEVVSQAILGYGIACQTGLDLAGKQDILVFVDGDNSVDVSEMPKLLDRIIAGADLVVGSRCVERQEPGSLTLPQQFGNWLATLLIRRFWGFPISDIGPFRAITVNALDRINMQDRRFGWTVEMQVRAIQEKMLVCEVPVSTRQRIGQSKISGTLRGVVLAGHDILGTIFKLKLKELERTHYRLHTFLGQRF